MFFKPRPALGAKDAWFEKHSHPLIGFPQSAPADFAQVLGVSKEQRAANIKATPK